MIKNQNNIRSIKSKNVNEFVEIYNNLNEKELDEEIDALFDQVVAVMIATNSINIETLFDGTHSLSFQFRELDNTQRLM